MYYLRINLFFFMGLKKFQQFRQFKRNHHHQFLKFFPVRAHGYLITNQEDDLCVFGSQFNFNTYCYYSCFKQYMKDYNLPRRMSGC